VLLRLDALGEDEGAGPLGVGVDGVHDLGDGRARTLLHQAQVELDDVGSEQREEGERHRVGAHVVDGDPPAQRPDPLDGAQQLGRACGEGPLGDLDDDAQVLGCAVGDGQQLVQRSAVEDLGLDVDEDGQRGQQILLDRPLEGGGAADLVELGQPAGRARGGEQQVRALQPALRATRQGLVGDDAARVELDDRLVHAAHTAGSQRFVERARREIRRDVHTPPSAVRIGGVSPVAASPPNEGELRPAG
jgi:hypothetical protein